MREIIKYGPALALIGSLALAGCQTVDGTIQRGLPYVCAGAESVHEVFLGLTASFQPSPASIALEKGAYEQAARICADPASANTAKVIAEVVTLSAKIWRVIADERAKHPAAP